MEIVAENLSEKEENSEEPQGDAISHQGEHRCEQYVPGLPARAHRLNDHWSNFEGQLLNKPDTLSS